MFYTISLYFEIVVNLFSFVKHEIIPFFGKLMLIKVDLIQNTKSF